MKGTEHFKQVIKSYLDKRAESDELFRAKYETTTRTIEDIATYILNEVKASGCCGFTDDEIFSMAVHVIDEPDIEIGKSMTCGVVVKPPHRTDRGGKGRAESHCPQTLPR